MSSPSNGNKVIKSSKKKVLMGTKDIECQSQVSAIFFPFVW